MEEDSSDGFITVVKGKSTRSEPNRIAFYPTNAAVVVPDVCLKFSRADWQVGASGVIRLRMSEHGQYAMRRASVRIRQMSAQALYTALGRELRGRYAVTRIDGCDIYVDVSEPVS